MSGQYPRTPVQDVSGSFLDQAACNHSYSSLPTSSVTSTYSSALSSTWPTLTQSNEGKSNDKVPCIPENADLDPEALMKILSDAGEPFFHHPPGTATTPTFSSEMTGTSFANLSSKNDSTKTNNSIDSSHGLTPSKNKQGSEQLDQPFSGSSLGNEKTVPSVAKTKMDSTISTQATKTILSSQVSCARVSSSNESLKNSSPVTMSANNMNNSSPQVAVNTAIKPKCPNFNSISQSTGEVVVSKEPAPKVVSWKPDPSANSSTNSWSQFGMPNMELNSNGARTPQSTTSPKKEISPNPDNVESLLESMFQISDTKAPEHVRTPSVPAQKSRVLRAESVEKILKSPSPPSFNGESNLDAIMKSPVKDSVEVKQEPVDENFARHSEVKENGNPPRINGKTPTDKPIKIFNEVESELEKMFAGIVQPETSGKSEQVLKTEKGSKKINSARRSSDNSILSSCSSSDNKRSKKSLKRIRNNRKDTKQLSKKFKIDKDTSNDSFYSKLRGPVIHVEGPKENPTSYTIINCRSKPEDEETQDSKVSLLKKKGPQQRVSSSKISEGNLETIKSTDEMWICLFCKKGPHVSGVSGDASGDLFGPYYIKDKDFVSPGSSDQKVKKKKKLTDAKTAMLLAEGILSVPNSNEFEVWVHENCCIWASGVYLVGSKLQGLEDAAWAACVTKCDHCGISGASIGCVVRHCQKTVHYSCALRTGWHLDQGTFITQCSEHEMTPANFYANASLMVQPVKLKLKLSLPK